MNKVMITKKLKDDLLKFLYKRQFDLCGYGVRDLTVGKLPTTAGSIVAAKIPEMIDTSGNLTRYRLVATAQELALDGKVQFNENNTEFWLTQVGYLSVERGCIGKCFDFLNKNPGIAIPISLAALVISLFETVCG